MYSNFICTLIILFFLQFNFSSSDVINLIQKSYISATGDAKRLPGEVIAIQGNIPNFGRFFAEVFLGNSHQGPFEVHVDTGSSDLLIYGTQCSGCASTEYDYHPSGSPVTCGSFGFTCSSCGSFDSHSNICFFSDTYGDGSNAQGSLMMDKFQVGFFPSVDISFGDITSASSNFEVAPASGIWGLAFPTIAVAPMVFDSMASQLPITNVFSLCLDAPNPVMSIGIDYSSNSAFTFTPLTTYNGQHLYYSISLQDLLVGGNSLGQPPSAYNSPFTIIDSGTTLILLPQNPFNAFVNSLYALCVVGTCGTYAGQSIFDGLCYSMTQTQHDAYPTMTFLISGLPALTIGPQDYLIPLVANNVTYYCMGVASSGNIGFTILGDTFMQAFHFVFDRANFRLGVANLSTCQAPTQLTTGRFTTGQFTTGQATTGQVTTGQFTTGQVTTGQVTTGRVTTGAVTTGSISQPPNIVLGNLGGFSCPMETSLCSVLPVSLSIPGVGNVNMAPKDFHFLSNNNFFATSGDVEGRVGVRNNMTAGPGYSVGYRVTDNTGSLVVGANLNFSSGAVYPTPSLIYVGQQFIGASDLVARRANSQCSNCFSPLFDAAANCYSSTSQALNAIAPTISWHVQYGTFSFDCTSNPNRVVNVISISPSTINSVSSYNVSNPFCNFSIPLIININGAGNIVFSGSPFPFSDLLFNIPGGNSITVSTGMNGNILAPSSTLTMNYGIVVGKVYVQDAIRVWQVNVPACLTLTQSTTTSSPSATTGSITTGQVSTTGSPIVPLGSLTCTLETTQCSMIPVSLSIPGVGTMNIAPSMFSFISNSNFYATSGDIEGGAAVRNNMQVGAGYSIGYLNSPYSALLNSSLLVGGNLNFTSGAVFPPTSPIFVGGSFTGAAALVSRLGNSPCSGCFDPLFNAAQTCYSSTSQVLDSKTQNTLWHIQYHSLVFDCVQDSRTMNIIHIDASIFSTVTGYDVSNPNCNMTLPTIINIDGTNDVIFSGAAIQLPTSSTTLIYNVPNGNRVFVQSGVNGNLLAPQSSLTMQNGMINGKVVVQNASMVWQVNVRPCTNFQVPLP